MSSSEQVEWLVDTFGATLFRVAFSIVRDRGAAEDVVQEVLVKAWSAMPSWEGDVPLRWARTVTRNTAVSYLRTQAARPSDPVARIDLLAGTVDGPEAVVERSWNAEQMWSALGALAADERAMLVMHELDGMSYEELAEEFEVTVASVKSKLFRARRRLKGSVD